MYIYIYIHIHLQINIHLLFHCRTIGYYLFYNQNTEIRKNHFSRNSMGLGSRALTSPMPQKETLKRKHAILSRGSNALDLFLASKDKDGVQMGGNGETVCAQVHVYIQTYVPAERGPSSTSTAKSTTHGTLFLPPYSAITFDLLPGYRPSCLHRDGKSKRVDRTSGGSKRSHIHQNT